MIGSAFEVRGGVSAVARVCAQHGLFERCDVAYVATHCDGSARDKVLRALRAWLEFTAMLLRGRVALLHVHLNSDASFWRKALFVVPAIVFGVPYVLQVHCGAFPEFYRARCSPRAQRFVRWLLRRARAVVALSEASRRSLTFIDPRLEVLVIPNPVEIPAWRAPLTEGPPTVLFFGMVKEAKGAFDLLRAWPAVREAIPEARLVLGGAGDLERAREMAREHGFPLETPGWVLGDEKAGLLRRAWVLVLPSHWEAMPMAVLEAMAAGVPVVASRVGGIPGVVVDGKTGRLVEPRDVNALGEALARILGDAAERLAMGAAARERAVGHFSADVVVPRLEAVWEAHARWTTAPRTARSRGVNWGRHPSGKSPRIHIPEHPQ
jgi:glycosyltransferase involved in cell wall biosynthesis